MLESDEQRENASAETVRLIAQAQRRLYAFIFALVRRAADVEDILQETNVVLWRKRSEFQAETDFMSWAFEIARRQVLSFRSKQVRGEPFDEALLAELAEVARRELEQLDRREDALRHCLEKLPPEHRRLILRRYQPGVTVNSIASDLGKSAKAVSETLRRIREALSQCIERTLASEIRP